MPRGPGSFPSNILIPSPQSPIDRKIEKRKVVVVVVVVVVVGVPFPLQVKGELLCT